MGLLVRKISANEIATGSIDFNGTVDVNYDRVTIPLFSGGNPTAANIGSTHFTIQVWIQPSSTGNDGSGAAWFNGNIFIDRDVVGGNPRSYGLSLRDGQVTFYVQSTAGADTLVGGPDIRDDEWHWIAVTFNRTTGAIQLYVDGTRADTGNAGAGDVHLATESGTAKNNLIELGGEKHLQGTPAFNGLVGEMRFLNVVFSTAASVTPPAEPLGEDGDTVGYWTFDDGAGTTVTDQTGNTNGTRVLNGGNPPPSWSAATPYS